MVTQSTKHNVIKFKILRVGSLKGGERVGLWGLNI